MTLLSCSWRQDFHRIEVSFISYLANERVFLPRPVVRAKLISNLRASTLTPKKNTTFSRPHEKTYFQTSCFHYIWPAPGYLKRLKWKNSSTHCTQANSELLLMLSSQRQSVRWRRYTKGFAKRGTPSRNNSRPRFPY